MRQAFGKLLLFGATGDLAQRMLLPSLHGLHADGGLLPAGLTIMGTARSTLSDAEYREFAAKALTTFRPDDGKDDGAIASFLDRLQYQALDISATEGFDDLAAKIGDTSDGLAIFLSTAPTLFEPTIKGLAAAGLAGSNVRIGLEKPLGTDLPSSCEINDAVAAIFPEDRIFRIDHYLGKETVQNILALRFGNSLFEPVWNASGIEHIEITVSETVGLEGRAGYYDDVGALRDMVQSHILQLLALIAMEPPARFDGTSIRDKKVKVLRSLRAIKGQDAANLTVTGQYTGGASSGKIVTGYAEELEKPSRTETFVAVKAHVDNWRWQGVPFYLRTGKRMTERYSEIVVQFKPVPHSIFAERGGLLQSNTLIIRIQPEEYVRLLVIAKEPGLDREGVRLREVPLNLSLEHRFAGARRHIAYERLLLDLLEGDPTLFVRRDEVEAQWAWIDGIRAGWDMADVRPKPYAADTWGPSAAIALTERDGVT